MGDAIYERVLCVKNEVLVYRIPPRPSNRGYRADDWKLDSPDWTGRLRVVSKGKDLFIKLEDKNSGELFAQCPVEAYPSIAVESVMDSSRYFVIRIKDDSGKSAFIGIGFHDRSDSFDLNVSIQDHFKQLKQEAEGVKCSLEPGPKLDLGFKAGQTITLNLGKGGSRPRNKPTAKPGNGLGFLPPPPSGSGKIAPPAAASNNLISAPPTSYTFQQPQEESMNSMNLGATLLDSQPLQPTSTQNTDSWGDFTGAAVGSQSSSTNSSSSNWVQF